MALVISGQPAGADILEAWANIFAEYVDLSQDADATYILLLQSQIGILQHTLSEVETAIYFLSLMYREELVTIIRDQGYEIEINPDDAINDLDNYLHSLDLANEQLASDRLRLTTLSQEYATIIKASAGEVTDELYFAKMLRRLARYCNVPVLRPKDLFVQEYVLLLKDYIEYLKANNKNIEPETEEAL